MERQCINCKYSIYPESVHDFFKKTMHLPQYLDEWGKDYRKQFFYLCSNPDVAEIDNVNKTTIYTECYKHNFNGECQYYKEAETEDIIPSTLAISSDQTEIEEGTEYEAEVTVTAAEGSDQTIQYSYQWYINGRTYWKYKETELKTTLPKGDYEFFCEVTQKIADNGDGGKKVYVSRTDTVSVTIKEKEEPSEDTPSDSEESGD